MAEPRDLGNLPMSRPGEWYACLYVKEFPAQAMLRLRPALCDTACVVLQGEPPLQQVLSLNHKARRIGVTTGMTRVEVDTFSAMTLLSRSEAEESSAQATLLECAGIFTPRIEAVSEGNTYLCVLDITGTEKLHGPPATLARSLLDRVRVLGFQVSITVSRNFHASICLARGISSGFRTAVILPGEERAALASLPLRVLDLSREHADTFSMWGIHTLGMLASLPEKALIARMGQEGQRLRQLARGEMHHHFHPVEAVFKLEERLELETPVELLDSLLFVLGVMLEQLILRATARILALASVTVALTLDGGSIHTRAVRPALPTNDRKVWIKLLHLDLEAHPAVAAILSLHVSAEPGITSKVQMGLFSPQLPEATRLDVTLARIRSIVGEGCVGSAVLRDTHQPDAFRMDTFRVLPESRDRLAADHAGTSMRQLRPAETLSVMLNGKTPASFTFREIRYFVERAYGPWLASGNWWNPTLWSKEQWDIVARSREGSLICCCVVRHPEQDQWQMVALYD